MKTYTKKTEAPRLVIKHDENADNPRALGDGNGEVYRFTLYDENGEEVDACGGFYEIEYIRDPLPEEWKNEKLEDYIQR